MPTLRPSAPPERPRPPASVLDRRGVAALEQLLADDFHDCLDAM